MTAASVIATYVIETSLPLARAAEVLAGEQSTGTFVRVERESDDVRARFAAQVESLDGEGQHGVVAALERERGRHGGRGVSGAHGLSVSGWEKGAEDGRSGGITPNRRKRKGRGPSSTGPHMGSAVPQRESGQDAARARGRASRYGPTRRGDGAALEVRV